MSITHSRFNPHVPLAIEETANEYIPHNGMMVIKSDILKKTDIVLFIVVPLIFNKRFKYKNRFFLYVFYNFRFAISIYSRSSNLNSLLLDIQIIRKMVFESLIAFGIGNRNGNRNVIFHR